MSPHDDMPAKVSKSQRERYERERKQKWETMNTLVAFALWISPVWDENNEDDVMAATKSVDEFLERRVAG